MTCPEQQFAEFKEHDLQVKFAKLESNNQQQQFAKQVVRSNKFQKKVAKSNNLQIRTYSAIFHNFGSLELFSTQTTVPMKVGRLYFRQPAIAIWLLHHCTVDLQFLTQKSAHLSLFSYCWSDTSCMYGRPPLKTADDGVQHLKQTWQQQRLGILPWDSTLSTELSMQTS